MLYFVLINRIISFDWLNIFVLLYISLMTYNILNCFNVANYSAFSSFTHIYTTIYTLNCILTQDEEALLSYFISLICIYFLFSGNFTLFFKLYTRVLFATLYNLLLLFFVLSFSAQCYRLPSNFNHLQHVRLHSEMMKKTIKKIK